MIENGKREFARVCLLLNASLLIAASFATASPAHTESLPQSPLVLTEPRWAFPEVEQVMAAIERKDCRTAWDAMWPLAKKGRAEARYFLWALTASGIVSPPGRASMPEESALRHRLTIAAYAAASPKGEMPLRGAPDHRWARNEIPLMISKLKQTSNTEQAARCYRSGASFKEWLRPPILRRGASRDTR